MSVSSAHGLPGASAGQLPFGVTWVPVEGARMFLGEEASGSPAHDLAAVAVRLRAEFAFVPADEPWAAGCARELRAAGLAVAWAVPGPLGAVAGEHGWSAVIAATASSPGDLAGPLARALHDSADMLRAGAQAGADFVVVADDLAADQGWLVSPDFALSAVVPCLEHLADVAGPLGLPVVFHSDGDVRALYRSLAAAGYSGVHLAPGGHRGLSEAVDAASSAGLLAFGGVRTADLEHTPPESIAGELIAHRARGGLVACDDGGLTEPWQLHALARVFTTIASGEKA